MGIGNRDNHIKYIIGYVIKIYPLTKDAITNINNIWGCTYGHHRHEEILTIRAGDNTWTAIQIQNNNMIHMHMTIAQHVPLPKAMRSNNKH